MPLLPTVLALFWQRSNIIPLFFCHISSNHRQVRFLCRLWQLFCHLWLLLSKASCVQLKKLLSKSLPLLPALQILSKPQKSQEPTIDSSSHPLCAKQMRFTANVSILKQVMMDITLGLKEYEEMRREEREGLDFMSLY